MKHVSVLTLSSCLSDAAALIAPDGKVLLVSTELAESVGDISGRQCYEALAGLAQPCPFCPRREFGSGYGESVHGVAQVRRGRLSFVDVRCIPDVADTPLFLETERCPNQGERGMIDQKRDTMLPELLRKLSGLLQIGRDLMGSAPLREKLDKVLKDLKTVLFPSDNVTLWVEIDSNNYGESPGGADRRLFDRAIHVEGTVRGHLYVYGAKDRELFTEDEYFLQETAELIARQVEISDLEDMLKQSEARYKKLAANLAKEIWNRTEALAKDTGYLEGILRCSEDMIITTDLEQRIVQFNPAAEKMVGYTTEEMQGHLISELWVNPEERNNVLHDVLLTGGIRNYETLLRAKSGEVVEISLTLSLLKDEQGKPVGTVGVSKDIGREKSFLRELERLNWNYRETIHFINHENKNSLIVMGGFLQRLIKSEKDAARKKELEIVYHHSRFLEAMCKDFLVMAELEHGEFQIRRRPIADFYEEVILPAMIGIKERYPDSFQSYDTSMGGVGAIRVNGDPALLEVVYRNLFGNALKYGSPEGKIAFGVETRGDRLRFNVWNAGPGVAPDQVERIFEKFYRVHDEHTRHKRGTGLGLYNIRKIIETHGGRIWCETKPGEWINFIFELAAP